jgi:hypothetical protein
MYVLILITWTIGFPPGCINCTLEARGVTTAMHDFANFQSCAEAGEKVQKGILEEQRGINMHSYCVPK